MILNAVLVWVAGLLTLVPWGIYYLFFREPPPDVYLPVLLLMLFWVFCYWILVAPLLAVLKVRQVLRLIEMARSREQLRDALLSPDVQDAAIDLIASENRIPRFLARRVLRLLSERYASSSGTGPT